MKAKTAVLILAVLLAVPVFAQAPPSYAPEQLDQLVARIALYPDPLLAQVLAAATFPDQIPDAARWADQHHELTGQALADAIQADQLPWDPSVQALLPFPSVLDTMASDMGWTTDLGNAFLAQLSVPGLTSRLCLSIRPLSSYRTMIRESFSSGHGLVSWWVAPSVSASA